MSPRPNISNRAIENLAITSSLNDLLMSVLDKLQHPEFNPNGALNLGLAHNDLLLQRVMDKSRSCLDMVPNDVNYGAPEGSSELRALLSDFMSRHFRPYYPLKAEHIFAQTGAGTSVNQLVLSVSDPGDYCIVPAPYYGAFDYDVSVGTGVQILPVDLRDNEFGTTINLDQLEATYQTAVKDHRRVTSMVISNPDNPLARTYSRQDLLGFLVFAAKHNIHIIFDEIYAMSSFGHILKKDTKDSFISALSLPYKNYIDPTLVHVVYGMSKDFGLNGLRLGFIIDQYNEPLHEALRRIAPFSYTSTLTDRFFRNFFSDPKWIDDYVLDNKVALATSYRKTTQFLDLHNIDYLPATAGPFMLLNLESHLTKVNFEQEQELWKRMIHNGIYLSPGFAYHVNKPGFFRLTFALPWDILEIGLYRLVDTIKSS